LLVIISIINLNLFVKTLAKLNFLKLNNKLLSKSLFPLNREIAFLIFLLIKGIFEIATPLFLVFKEFCLKDAI